MTSMNDVNIETGKVEVEVFTKTDAALSILREKYAKGKLPDVNTPDGYEFVKAGVKELTTYRTSLDKERQRIKAPYLEAGRIIDAEAKRITGELVAIEEPLKAMKKEVDDREKRQKEERLARLRAKIADMTSHVEKARGRDSAEIAEMIETVDAIDTQADFYELTEEAVRAQADTLDKLGAMYSDRIQFEQAEAARKEAEEKARAQAQAQRITERLNTLRMMPMEMMGKPADEIRAKLGSLKKYAPPADEFGDRLQEAHEAQDKVIEQLQTMLTQAEQLEEAQAAESRRMDEQLQRDMAATRPAVEERMTDPGPGCEVPKHYGVDMASGPDKTVEHVVSSTACDDQLADDPEAPGVDSRIPSDEMVSVEERIQQHGENADLLQAISDWCDKWEVSTDASLELGEIIEKYLK